MDTAMSQEIKAEFDVKRELEFWGSFEYKEDSDTKLIERFKKIRNEKISREEVNDIFSNMQRMLPIDKQPSFFLKLFVELPKKDCEVSKVFKYNIKKMCKTYFEKMDIDSIYIDSIGKEIFLSDDRDGYISTFIKKVLSCAGDCNYKEQDVLAFTYIWLVTNCEEYRHFEGWKMTLVIEKVFAELLRSQNEKDIRDCTLKSVPKAIANGTYKKQLLSFSYLHLEDIKKLKELEQVQVHLCSTLKTLNEEKSADREKIKTLNDVVKELNTELSVTKETCEQLKKELTLKENVLKFEKNRFEQQFISKEKNLMSEVESVIGLEIEGIEEIAARLPERERERILRRIRRIRDRITELGG